MNIAKDYLEYYLSNLKNELINIEDFVDPTFIVQSKLQINPIIDEGLNWLQENDNTTTDIYNNKQIEIDNIISPLIQTIFSSGLQPGRLMSPIYYNQNSSINIIKYYLFDIKMFLIRKKSEVIPIIYDNIKLKIDNIINETVTWFNENSNSDIINYNNKLTELIHIINPLKNYINFKSFNNYEIIRNNIKLYLFDYKNMLTNRAGQVSSPEINQIKEEINIIVNDELIWLQNNNSNNISYENKFKDLKNKINPLKQKLFSILTS